MLPEPEIVPYGEAAVLVRYEVSGYSAEIMAHIHALSDTLAKDLTSSRIWIDIVPGYDSLLATFDPLKLDIKTAIKAVTSVLPNVTVNGSTGKTVEVPVVYGGAFGPDMDTIMKQAYLSEEDVIKLHSETTYTVCMLGFIPGFVFLSDAPEPLHHSRHKTPRLKVPSGSVGIAGWQTGIYGLESPGGWQIIGRTPLKTFNPFSPDPFPITAGDKVQFVPIAEANFDD